MGKLEDISAAVISGDVKVVTSLTESALAEGIPPKEVLDRGLMPGMDYVGQQFKKGEMFVPEVLLSARTMQAAMSILKPKLAAAGEKMVGKVLIGTVQGDLHDIGKNIVAMTLGAGGYRVIDLGVDVPPPKIIDALQKENASILALSCLITTTMDAMAGTVKALAGAGLQGKIKVMIGGPPTTEEFARKIGVDFRGKDAYEALLQANRWTGAL